MPTPSGPRAGTDERIEAAEAARILGYPVSTLNTSRRAMQLVRDRASRRLLPYPSFERDKLGNALTAAERRRLEVAFDAVNLLVVPEWGGIRYPKSSWTYSRQQCEALRDHGVAALEQLAAWQAPQ